METQIKSIFKKTYRTVSPAAASYYKTVWLVTMKRSDRTFRHRMIKPKFEDVLLLCHVCDLDLGETLKPFLAQFKNIPAFNKNLQLTIEQ